MRLHPAQLGNWRSVALFSLEQPLDLMGLTVLFGANGSGKTNILEAIAGLLDAVARPEGLRDAIRVDRRRPDEGRYPGFLVVEFDRWRDDDQPDRQILWTLFTNPGVEGVLLDEESWRSVPGTVRDQLDELRKGFPSPCPSTAALGMAMRLWSQAMAAAGTAGQPHERRTLARALLAQCLFDLPIGLPMVIPARLPEDARRAAVAIDAAGGAARWDDPLWDAAHSVSASLDADRPVSMRASYPRSPQRGLGEFVVDDVGRALGDVWVVNADSDGLHDDLRAALSSVAVEALAEEANRLLPSFVQSRGEIVLELGAGPLPGVAVVDVALREHDGAACGIDVLGRGVARWVAIALRAAARRLRAGPAAGAALAPFPGVLLIDEPEAHLHPGAVKSVAQWLVDRNRQDGIGVVVATHEVDLLDLPAESAQLVYVSRAPGQYTKAEPVGGDLLGTLETHAADLGLSRGQILLRTKGVLIVEGVHDVAVVRHYYDRHLRERRMLMLPLHGLHEALSLVELEFLSRLDVPLVLLCDNARRELLRKGRLPDVPTAEEQKIFLLLLSLSGASRLHVVSHGLPDVICALPDAAVATVVRAAGQEQWAGWARVAEAARRRGTPIKDHLADRLGVTVDAHFVAEVLRAADPALPAASLDRAMQEALAVGTGVGR
jgi:energy-coupling factor transporter ATP-binding protein EcfA2